MSRDNHLSQGIIEDVFYPRGVNSDTGRAKMQKAPFQLLAFQTADGARELFVMPNSMSGDLDQAFAADTPTEKESMARDDFGYFTGEFHVVDESMMGDYVGNHSNWRGYHCFGLY